MGNELFIREDEFCGMKQEDKLLILFRNQVKTLDLVKGYKFYYKITTIIGSFLTCGMLALFYLLIEHIRGF